MLDSSAAFGVVGRPQAARASGDPDWAARVASLPKPADGEITLTAVGDLILSEPDRRTEPAATNLASIFLGADVAYGNCEQAVASTGYTEAKSALMAWPSILEKIRAAGFDVLGLANNHFMDLGEEAALEGLREMRRHGFVTAGGGGDLEEANTVGVIEAPELRVGFLQFWCTSGATGSITPAFLRLARAGTGKPGISIVEGHDVVSPPHADSPETGILNSVLLPDAGNLKSLTEAIQRARPQVDVLAVSLHQHWGPGGNAINEGRKIISRAAVDAGADVVIGHGPHMLNAIEVYRGRPIMYSLSHFYFQGWRDGEPLQRFMQSPSAIKLMSTFNTPEHRMSCIARMAIGPRGVTRLDVLPVQVNVQEEGLPSLADDEFGRQVIAHLQKLSKPFGTRIHQEDWYGRVELAG